MRKYKVPPKTLAATYKECIRMWKWIVKEYYRRNEGTGIEALKREWLAINGYNWKEISGRCFFCHYTTQAGDDETCKACAGRIVSLEFSCNDESYGYDIKPHEFLNKILELDRIRKEKRIKR